MKANNSLRINMPRALELISFFSSVWSDLSDIRLIRVRHNENCRGKYVELFEKDCASAGRNSQYISPRIQNEVISVAMA